MMGLSGPPRRAIVTCYRDRRAQLIVFDRRGQMIRCGISVPPDRNGIAMIDWAWTMSLQSARQMFPYMIWLIGTERRLAMGKRD